MMKYFLRMLACDLSLCAFVLLSACSDGVAQQNDGWKLEGSVPVYVSQWPENEYTSKILKPQSGEIDFIYDYSDSGRYAVFWKDISDEESAVYIEALKDLGYKEIISEGNDASVGTLLKKDGTILSVSFSKTILGILINIEE